MPEKVPAAAEHTNPHLCFDVLTAQRPRGKMAQVRWLWPDIAQAIKGGHTLKDICEHLQQYGLDIGVAVLLGFAWGGIRRAARAQTAARDAGLPKNVAPATQAGREFTSGIPLGNAAVVRRTAEGVAPELQPPGAPPQQTSTMAPCGTDPRSGQPWLYNPQTGQPCDGLPQERIVVRQAPVNRMPSGQPATIQLQSEPTPEERRVAATRQREQEAILSLTSVGGGQAGVGVDRPADDSSQLAALNAALARNRVAESATPDPARATGQSEGDYDVQNMQARQQAFLAAARIGRTDDYLASTRTAPISRYEIKAGWEIPAVPEQSLNSDLPGELKALVTSNVYDTATGMYLLIPQGSRLVGHYDSRISAGQDGVQVVWSRIIYPDASSIDLDGMLGLDSHGNAGLRDKVDHHYARLVGFSALTSLFTAAFPISQQGNQSVLVNPSAGQVASGAVGQELSETGAQMTRRNLNVQPTIKVPAGYKFTVRVNRDILFEAPYESIEPAR
jgi:type IV secretion system protein VirB10